MNRGKYTTLVITLLISATTSLAETPLPTPSEEQLRDPVVRALYESYKKTQDKVQRERFALELNAKVLAHIAAARVRAQQEQQYFNNVEVAISNAFPGVFTTCQAADYACKKHIIGSLDAKKLEDAVGGKENLNKGLAAYQKRAENPDSYRSDGNDYTDPSSGYSTKRSDFNLNQQAEVARKDPANVCAEMKEMAEKKTKRSQWQAEVCPKIKTDADMAKLDANQKSDCAYWQYAQTSTLKELCAAKDDAKDASKSLLTLGAVNLAAGTVCGVEYQVMKKAAGVGDRAKKTGTTPETRLAMNYLRKPWFCITAAMGNTAMEVVTVVNMLGKNKNAMGMDKSMKNGELNKSDLNVNNILKYTNALASAGVSIKVLTRTVQLIKEKGVCTSKDMASLIGINAKLGDEFKKEQLARAQRRVYRKVNKSPADSAIEKRCAGMAELARDPRKNASLADEALRGIASFIPSGSPLRPYEHSEEDLIFMTILTSLGHRDPHEKFIENEETALFLDVLTADLMGSAGA